MNLGLAGALATAAAIGIMAGTVAGTVAGIMVGIALSVAVGVVAGVLRIAGRSRHGVRNSDPPATRASHADTLPAPDQRHGLAGQSLDVLRVGVVVLGPDDEVSYANPSAHALELVNERDGRSTVSHPVLRSLAWRVRRSGQTRDVELELPHGAQPLPVRVRVVALRDAYVAIEVEDMTEAHQVAQVRRDFVANVSHELKTPVGALQLLSEALWDATEDLEGDDSQRHEAIRRFTERIRHESNRLGRLVSELLELSRLQGGEPLPPPEPVAIDRVINEVIDHSRTTAAAKEITITTTGSRGVKLYGHERLLVTAVANLVDNAIAYSPERTTVTIAVERTGDDVEISVTDEGIGIAEQDLGRIFERFYRADPARSRATGGTGLGLAIVKHIASNHGGRVTVRSTVGSGSTFTLRLPSGHPDRVPALHRTGELDAATILRKPGRHADQREAPEGAPRASQDQTGNRAGSGDGSTDGSGAGSTDGSGAGSPAPITEPPTSDGSPRHRSGSATQLVQRGSTQHQGHVPVTTTVRQ